MGDKHGSPMSYNNISRCVYIVVYDRCVGECVV